MSTQKYPILAISSWRPEVNKSVQYRCTQVYNTGSVQYVYTGKHRFCTVQVYTHLEAVHQQSHVLEPHAAAVLVEVEADEADVPFLERHHVVKEHVGEDPLPPDPVDQSDVSISIMI